MTRRQTEWPAWILIGLFATAIAANAFEYSVLVPQQQLRYEMHRAIVDGTAPSPQRFRILVPWLLDPLIRAASTLTEPGQAFRRVYFAFHFAALTLLLAGVYAYARLWFSRDQAVIGSLIVGTTVHIVLRMGEYWDFAPIPPQTWFAPWSLLEPVFVAAGLVLLVHRRIGALAVLTVIGALNSEASVVLPLLALVTRKRENRGAVVLMLWIAVTLLVRIGIGGFAWPAPAMVENLAHLPTAAINIGLFLGPALLLALTGLRHTPSFARRSLLAAVPLIVAIAVFGSWWDVRLLTSLYPLTMPLVLSALFEPARSQLLK